MTKAKITPLYERLSRDDELQCESNSIIYSNCWPFRASQKYSLFEDIDLIAFHSCIIPFGVLK